MYGRVHKERTWLTGNFFLELKSKADGLLVMGQSK
jgi:hypothetical protein